MDVETFCWHTSRAENYQDAYWQWLKASHYGLEMALSTTPDMYSIFKFVYTCGWQYEMKIISAPEFKAALHTAAQQLGDQSAETHRRGYYQPTREPFSRTLRERSGVSVP
jgi:hypothetical protein